MKGGHLPPTAAMVAMIAVVAFTPVLAGGRTFDTAAHAGDTLVWHARVADAIGGGHLPEWDDTAGLGASLTGDAQRAALYPPAWLTAALPLPWAVDALLIAHLALLGAGVAAWARRRGADPVATAVAGGAVMLSVSATTLAIEGGALYAIAWLPWIGWAADRLASARGARGLVGAASALAAIAGALALAGATGALVAAPAIAALAVIAVAPRRAGAWVALALALGGGAALGALALVPAALGGGDWFARGAGALARLGGSDLALLVVAVAAAAVPDDGDEGAPPRRLAIGGGLMLAAGWALGARGGADGVWLAGISSAGVVAAVGLSRAQAAILAMPAPSGDGEAVAPPLWRAAAAALLVAVVLGVPAARAWRGLPLQPRDAVAGPPALLADLAPARIAWPDDEARDYADAPPDTGARFGFAYLPGRDRARDPELTALWRRSSGAAERLLDLFGVELVLVPRSVVVPASLPVVSSTAGGVWVLARNPQRRARAFVAPRASWHRDDEAVARVLFPAAPEERGSLPLAEVRLVGTGPPGKSSEGISRDDRQGVVGLPPRTGPTPAPACEIDAPRPEEVALACSAPHGGHAVLLDRFAPGWTAEVDGRAAPIERADLLARAVAIPPGRHEIIFRYRAPGLRAGAAISLGAWVALLVLAIASWGQRRRAVPIEPG